MCRLFRRRHRGGTDRDEVFDEFQPKVSLRWDASDDWTFFASWGRGFKSGGFNVRAQATAFPESALPFDDEVLTVAEVGVKSVLGANAAHVSARFDERTGTVIAMCAIDNLTKGASGGALQAANVALGLDETAGLASVGVAP